MGFQRTVPHSCGELKAYLEKIHQNRKHVKGVEVNLTTGHLEIALDFGAHIAGNPDVFLPIKHGKLNEAKDLAERMMRESSQGYQPSDVEAQMLYDLIDPVGQ